MGNHCSARSASNVCSQKSTIIAEKETGSHVLEVKGYSITKDLLGVGKSINSDVFSVAGHNWAIEFYPGGLNQDSADYISLYLFIRNPIPRAGVKARFCFSLLINNGAGQPPVSMETCTSEIRTFSYTESWGFSKFIEREVLETLYLSRDDSFQIKCDLTVFKDIRMETLTPPPPPPPSLGLPRHLGDLLASKVGVDVEFEVDGEVFMAHRCVLAARSSVFMAELFGPMALTGHVRVVRDMEARVFRCMLHFIYTDSLPEIDVLDKSVMAQHLLVAADRYDLQRLKLICEDMLRSSVDVGIAATTLVLAEQHGCQRLKAVCFEFFRAPGNLKAVMATDGFQHLKNSSPSLVEELLAQVAP